MATYCTHRQLKDIYSQIDTFDSKKKIHGWVDGLTTNDGGLKDVYNGQTDVGFCHNTGLVTQLFIDGIEIKEISYNDTHVGTLDGALDDGGTFTMDSALHGIASGDIVKINGEYMYISTVDGVTVTITSPGAMRGLFHTSMTNHDSGSKVFKIIDVSTDVGDEASAGHDALAYVYDKYLDLTLIIHNTLTLSNHNIESGEDFTTFINRKLAEASRILDSKLNSSLPSEMQKDKEGNYDAIIARTTGLIAVSNMIRSSGTNFELANNYLDEALENIDDLNSGKATLSWQKTGDSSKGVIREVGTVSGALRPVDTRGRWNGTFDKFKVMIVAAGAIATAKYSVWGKDSEVLKATALVTAEIINGDYQTISGGLQIRFDGALSTSEATLNDEWEIEVHGEFEEVDNSTLNSVKMTRKGYKTTRYRNLDF